MLVLTISSSSRRWSSDGFEAPYRGFDHFFSHSQFESSSKDESSVFWASLQKLFPVWMVLPRPATLRLGVRWWRRDRVAIEKLSMRQGATEGFSVA